MSPSDDGGYVHDPSNFDEEGNRSAERSEEAEEDRRPDDGTADADATGADWVEDPVHPAAREREFGWRGWVLVGVIVLAFVVAPALIVWRPPALPYRVTLLVLPLFPAVLLAAVAVWATTRP